jgi:Mn-dependent DtxR family transcriptional regulator
MTTTLFAPPFSGSSASPGRSANLKEREKITRADRIPSRLHRLIEKLRAKWIDFSNGIVRAIARELRHIRQQEIRDQLRSHNQRRPSQDALQQ